MPFGEGQSIDGEEIRRLRTILGQTVDVSGVVSIKIPGSLLTMVEVSAPVLPGMESPGEERMRSEILDLLASCDEAKAIQAGKQRR